MRTSFPTKLRHGFSLIELIVVVAIIGILVALLMVGVAKVRVAASRANCRSNLHQLGLALDMYHDAMGVFPDAAQLPSAAPGRPGLPAALTNFVENSQKIFQCPQDSAYYPKERTSYEYPATVAGRIREELTEGGTKGSDQVWLLYDYNAIHGTAGAGNARCFLFLDSHVE